MNKLKPNSCFRITYPDSAPIEFRTPEEIPVDIALTLVILRNKKVINIRDLLEERWDHFMEIPCEEIFDDIF